MSYNHNRSNEECDCLIKKIEADHPEWNTARVSEELVKIVEKSDKDSPLTRFMGRVVDTLLNMK